MRLPAGALLRAAGSVLAALLLSSTTAPAGARDEARGLKVSLECNPERAPGRVLCRLGFEVAGRGHLDWADAIVVSAPDFAKPLRSRVGPRQGKRTGPGALELPLALAATRGGRGDLRVEARAVVCAEGKRGACTPVTRVVSAEVQVGARQER